MHVLKIRKGKLNHLMKYCVCLLGSVCFDVKCFSPKNNFNRKYFSKNNFLKKSQYIYYLFILNSKLRKCHNQVLEVY